MLICLELLRFRPSCVKSSPGIEQVLWKQSRLYTYIYTHLSHFAVWRCSSEGHLGQLDLPAQLMQNNKEATSYTDLVVSGVNRRGKSEIELK